MRHFNNNSENNQSKNEENEADQYHLMENQQTVLRGKKFYST